MLTVSQGVLTGVVAQVAVVTALAGTVGLSAAGGLAGVAYGVAAVGLLARALRRSGAAALGPADLVTLARSVLVGGVAALVVDSFSGPVPVGVLTGLAVVALLLDAVDGRVARSTRTVSAVGARFDMEVDSVLVLLLSVYVARSLGVWVLAIGSVRYVYWVAGRALPWLREPVPPRYWCKVVAAVQGGVLVTAAAGVLPRPVVVLALVGVGALLAESFGREAWRLWGAPRAGRVAPADRSVTDGATAAAAPWRRVPRAALTSLAVVLVWAVLVLPERLFRLSPEGFLRIPVELLVLVGLAVVLPRRWIGVVATVVGAVLGLITVLRIFDLGFRDALYRAVNPVDDWRLVPAAVDMLQESFGPGWATAAVVGAVLVVVLVPVFVTLSVVRVARTAAHHRRFAAGTASSLGVVWLVSAVVGLQLTPFHPVASRGAVDLAAQQVRDAVRNLGDRSVFDAEIAADDPWDGVPAAELLTGLRGKDVVFVFVESYGRVAVEDSPVAPDIRALLDAGTRTLQATGFGSRSAFLTSPTFGSVSWLAHATLHSGLWVDSQQRYDQLLPRERFTLPAAFARAGWRTVVQVPSNRHPWPEGRAFYGFDEDHDRTDVGYEGPKFSYAAMPDQYTLAAFERLELAPGSAPVMAEIDLVSSHHPWTPVPRLLDWADLGDGSAFHGMAEGQPAPEDVIGDTDRITALYGQSIEYALGSIVSFVTTFHADDDDLVLVVVGDHQPASVVHGSDASRDVPVTILTRDPAVLERTTAWGWDDGMRPGRDAPVWRMDAFRDRFLAAFGPSPGDLAVVAEPG